MHCKEDAKKINVIKKVSKRSNWKNISPFIFVLFLKIKRKNSFGRFAFQTGNKNPICVTGVCWICEKGRANVDGGGGGGILHIYSAYITYTRYANAYRIVL